MLHLLSSAPYDAKFSSCLNYVIEQCNKSAIPGNKKIKLILFQDAVYALNILHKNYPDIPTAFRAATSLQVLLASSCTTCTLRALAEPAPRRNSKTNGYIK